MNRKSVTSIIMAVLVCGSLVTGCGNDGNTTGNNAADNGKTAADNATDNGNNATQKLDDSADNAKNSVKDGAEAVKDGVEGVGDAIKYTAINAKDDIVNAGYDVKESADTAKDYFKGKETDYTVDNNLVRVYEYDNSADLDTDLKTISNDGLTINGTKVYDTSPYYYRKGNTLIVYEGTDNAYIDKFDTLYGKPVVTVS